MRSLLKGGFDRSINLFTATERFHNITEHETVTLLKWEHAHSNIVQQAAINYTALKGM